MATAEEIAREEYEAWCRRGYEGKGICQDALDLCERVARRVSIEATDGYASQPVISDIVEMLTAAGYGKPGQPNTLWAMVKAATHEVKHTRWFYGLRMDELQKYQKELPEPHRTIVCNILANGKPKP
jgi:hypothetical protein